MATATESTLKRASARQYRTNFPPWNLNVCILHMQNRHSLWLAADFVVALVIFFVQYFIRKVRREYQAERERGKTDREGVRRVQARYLSKMSPYRKSMVEFENRVSSTDVWVVRGNEHISSCLDRVNGDRFLSIFSIIFIHSSVRYFNKLKMELSVGVQEIIIILMSALISFHWK